MTIPLVDDLPPVITPATTLARIKQTAVILVNLGSPASPSVPDVRRYLTEFLSDPRVIDLPAFPRWVLVNLIIAPFRSPKSAKEYRKIWRDEGFPLVTHTRHLTEKLQESLGEEFDVHMAMRYQQPNLEAVIAQCEKANYQRLMIVPLFPQYASSTTGSVHEKVMSLISHWRCIPKLEFVDSYCNNADVAQAYGRVWQDSCDADDKLCEQWDHVLFSYHGLPEQHLIAENKSCIQTDCCEQYKDSNRLCYRAQCYQTSRHLADFLTLPASKQTTTFQSRLGKLPWIQPYTRDKVIELAEAGVKRLLVFCPAFTADCLETIVEVGEEYKALFIEHGGDELRLVDSLNDHPAWVEALRKMIVE